MIEFRPTRIVPCGRCTACCRGDAIYLHPECGDDESQYRTEPVGDGRSMLAHKRNRDCFYLDRRNGCMIWERRPTICRELDCRMLLGLGLPRRELIRRGMMTAKMYRAAKRRLCMATTGTDKD